jgi:twitching motility protein PilT
MCQALLPNSTGTGRVMAMEILVPNSAIRNLVREDKIHQIYSMMQTGSDKYGMQTLNQSLAALYRKRDITLETALAISSNQDELLDLVGRGRQVNQTGGSTPMAAGGSVGGVRPLIRTKFNEEGA